LTASSALDQGPARVEEGWSGLVLPFLPSKVAAARVSPTLANKSSPVTASPGSLRQDVHDYQQVKPDLFARLISRQRNQARHIQSGACIPDLHFGLKTRGFTPSYIITT
jgi:hypothetical protein